jgi:hypothetical protein
LDPFADTVYICSAECLYLPSVNLPMADIDFLPERADGVVAEVIANAIGHGRDDIIVATRLQLPGVGDPPTCDFA